MTTGGVTTIPVRFTVMELSGLTTTDAGVGFTVNVNVPPEEPGVGVIIGGVTTGGVTTGGVTTGGVTTGGVTTGGVTTGGVTTGGVTTGGVTTGGVTTGGVTTAAELPCMIACIPRVMAISLCPQNL